jgi:hypothetical protein
MSTPATPRPQALIVLSSARTLPLSKPAGSPGISTGFFLVELAAVMAAFEEDYDFILATPDGNPPQLDINGLALNFHAAGSMVSASARTTFQSAVKHATPQALREKNPDLLKRRNVELEQWRARFEAPDDEELRGSRIPPVPPEHATWSEWASRRWPSLPDGYGPT